MLDDGRAASQSWQAAKAGITSASRSATLDKADRLPPTKTYLNPQMARQSESLPSLSRLAHLDQLRHIPIESNFDKSLQELLAYWR